MIKLFLFATCLLCMLNASAQADSAAKTILVSTRGDTIKTATGEPTLLTVEKESEFPGGLEAWQRFLRVNLRYPQQAIKKEIQGTVVVQFIVCTDGTVCNVEVVSGPQELRQSALDAMKQTPNWEPAIYKGKKVRSYKRQFLYYRLN